MRLWICIFLSFEFSFLARGATTTPPAPTQATEAPASYSAGLQNYQEGHYDQAFTAFQNYFNAGHDSAPLDYNWGLTAVKVKKAGLAAGLLRRALFLNPDLRQAYAALDIVLEGLPHEWNEDPSTWTQFRTQLLDKLTLNQTLLLAWIFFCLSGLLLVRYFARRRQALRDQKPLPVFPSLSVALAVLFVFSFTISAAKIISLNEVRATVISATQLRTGPAAQDNAIFDLLEGFDVSVKSIQSGWVQVELDSGQVGWVPAQTLFQHTGHRRLW